MGGTFTHAVAIDNATLEVVAHAVTPTTHSAEGGVAEGIVGVFHRLKESLDFEFKVVFLAHSTTQATNAMLEGDVVKVAILGLASAMDLKAKADMEVGSIELSPGKFLSSALSFVSEKSGDAEILSTLEGLQKQGFGAVVASQPFSVDDASGEMRVLEQASKIGLAACATHEMSGLYGLRVRTRTAVLNASILPKMIDTAIMTEKSLRLAHVDAPLMIMRSDGGVMSLEEVRRRPVMTLLSGPAAGIAAALVYLRVSDAIFLEVGGTSTDICLIKDGRASVRSASLGGHPTYLKTLDSRTLGVAGGSMLRVHPDGKVEVGPRSAHVAGCHYASFSKPEFFAEASIEEVSPLSGDPPYLIFRHGDEKVTLTSTCAANYLGYIHAEHYSRGDEAAIAAAFEKMGAHLNRDPKELARAMMESVAEKVMPTIRQLMTDYGVKDRALKLIGGGGGATAVVPKVAEALSMPFEIAPRAEVISAIGAALAMVKETIEKNIVNPSPSELAALRREAEQAVIKMGADPSTVQVAVEVDSQRSVVRATATGSVEFVAGNPMEQQSSEEDRLKTLREASPREQAHELKGQTDTFYLYQSERSEKYFFNFFTRKKSTVWITDGRGAVKLQVPGGQIRQAPASELFRQLEQVLKDFTQYGDAGALIPPLHVLAGRKMVDLTALQSSEQVLGLAQQELGDFAQGESAVFFLVHPR